MCLLFVDKQFVDLKCYLESLFQHRSFSKLKKLLPRARRNGNARMLFPSSSTRPTDLSSGWMEGRKCRYYMRDQFWVSKMRWFHSRVEPWRNVFPLHIPLIHFKGVEECATIWGRRGKDGDGAAPAALPGPTRLMWRWRDFPVLLRSSLDYPGNIIP